MSFDTGFLLYDQNARTHSENFGVCAAIPGAGVAMYKHEGDATGARRYLESLGEILNPALILRSERFSIFLSQQLQAKSKVWTRNSSNFAMKVLLISVYLDLDFLFCSFINFWDVSILSYSSRF